MKIVYAGGILRGWIKQGDRTFMAVYTLKFITLISYYSLIVLQSCRCGMLILIDCWGLPPAIRYIESMMGHSSHKRILERRV